MNNELVKEINGTEYHFKFKSKKCIDLEKATGKQFLELLQDVSMEVIETILEIKKPSSILEIGTAVGYSAICFSAKIFPFIVFTSG